MSTRVSGGPLHYQIRAGAYGEIYDGTPLKVALEIAESKGRDTLDSSSVARSYNTTQIRINDSVENCRDYEVFKFRRPSTLSMAGSTTALTRELTTTECVKRSVYFSRASEHFQS
ncbi:unnamed protein product, partial [Allacma fusca]